MSDGSSEVRIENIWIYPVKSLHGFSVEAAEMTRRGPLEKDRGWVMKNEAGDLVTGKANPRVHAIAPAFELARDEVTIDGRTYRLGDSPLNALLSDRLGQRITVVRVPEGAPDHGRAPGPTLISRATLEEIGSWFGTDGDEMRRRMRPTLVTDADEPFWEDRLVPRPFHATEFAAGDSLLRAVFPIARCPVPARDSRSGTPHAGFQKEFVAKRRASLPAWAVAESFPHFYHAGVLTRVSRVAPLRVGDRIAIKRELPIDLSPRLLWRAALYRLQAMRAQR